MSGTGNAIGPNRNVAPNVCIAPNIACLASVLRNLLATDPAPAVPELLSLISAALCMAWWLVRCVWT